MGVGSAPTLPTNFKQDKLKKEIKIMAKLNLSPPWVVYYRKLSAFFKEDPEVRIAYDDIEQEIKLYVSNAEKAVALENLLPNEQNFGNVTLYITIVPANQTCFDSVKAGYSTNSNDIVRICFNNKAVVGVKVVDGIMTNRMTFVIFKKEVVQYFTDDIGDYHGICSTLYQDLAKEIFGSIDGVFFCTDNEIELGNAWL